MPELKMLSVPPTDVPNLAVESFLQEPLKVSNDNAPKLQLVFEAQTNRGDGLDAVAGETLLIDDVDVWETSGNCTETR